MCKAIEIYEEERETARAIENARKMIARGKLTLEEIAEDSGLPLTKVKELAGAKSA